MNLIKVPVDDLAGRQFDYALIEAFELGGGQISASFHFKHSRYYDNPKSAVEMVGNAVRRQYIGRDDIQDDPIETLRLVIRKRLGDVVEVPE